MFRGRPPLRGGYPPPFEGRGLPPPRPHPAPGYRDDRTRPRLPYHPDYRDHGRSESYRHSPPRRRYPSPGTGSHRGGEFWAGGPPDERSPSQRGPAPQDHNLVITVGNELIRPPGPAPPRHHERDYSSRPEYEQTRSRARSPDRSRAKSRGRSKSRSPDRSRAKSRGRSKSRSPDRSRAKSRGRSKSRSPDRSRAKSRGRSKSRSPDRSRAKSRGRSKSRPRGQSRSPDRSRARSRARSRGRSKNRHHSSSRSSSRSRGRTRGRSRGRSHARSRSSSSSSSSSNLGKNEKEAFKELEDARRRKELEEMLSQPTKSILKKRNNYDNSPSIGSSDSPREPHGTTISRVADQLLQAVRTTDPHTMASMLTELRSDPQLAQRPGFDAEIKEILHLLGGAAPGGGAQQKDVDDIDDEEKFLYGDSEELKPPTEPVRHHSLDLYGDVTEDSLYADPPSQRPVVAQMYGCPPLAVPHLQAPHTGSEVDQYTSRPGISSDQNITGQALDPAYPPGTEPLEESERQAMEEYEKIQDLLKTIGLDLGVVEISKMAARTKERLHGNKPPPKTPTHQQRYSSGSSDGSRGHRRRSHSASSSSSSSSSSRSRSRRQSGKRGASWSSEDDDGKKNMAPAKPPKDREPEAVTSGWSDVPPLPQTTNPAAIPPHPGLPIPTYPPPQVHSMMPPNFPPPAYSQYGSYMPYMHQQWPPIYPPPSMTPPPQTTIRDFPPTPPYKPPPDKPAPDAGVKGAARSSSQDEEQRRSRDRRVSDEQNNESQKQKVLEEREKLKDEREIRMKKKEYLIKELERLRKQQGELLRKKRREKDGHKDPLLQEISLLQDEVMAQISNLRKEHEAAEKKRSEIEKVALILGLSPSDRPSRTSKQPDIQEAEPPPQKKKRELERSPEGRLAAGCSAVKPAAASLSRASPDKPALSSPASAAPPDPFEYYDAGNHWCKNCNVTSGSMFDFFTHLHSKLHRKTLDPYDRPWASSPTKISKNTPAEEKQTKPAKGSEFLVPVRGFYCLLCQEFYGDAICAEEHVVTHTHNEKYKKQMYENPLYEQRRNLDRQAGLALEASGKKRKHDEPDKGKEKEEKAKHKKEKRDKEKKKEEDAVTHQDEKSKIKKEEEEERLKLSRREEDFKKSQEQERPSYSKNDEDEKIKFVKKENKFRYSREDEDKNTRYKSSNRDEEYRYRYRRNDDNRYDERLKYDPRDDEDKYRHERYSDMRSKFDRERDEGKLKAEREVDRPAGKPDIIKSEPPPKPYELPKIFCGPSPAMRAKLRKQSLEAGKAPATATSFGKFTWKKKENQLAKEAQKVAAEFLKEDETAVKEQAHVVEDSFAKSMAVAKEIAQKLAGEQPMPPPWFSAGRGRIRPNLPPPATQLRKAAMAGKPASLNTFLNIRPQSTSIPGPSTSPNIQTEKFQTKPGPSAPTPGPFELMPAPTVTKPEPFGPKLPPSMSKPELCVVHSAEPGSKPDQTESKAASSEAKQDLPGSKHVVVQSKPPPIQVDCAPPVSKASSAESKPAPLEAKSAPAQGKPGSFQAAKATPAPTKKTSVQPAMIKVVSDVAAPGVPEDEQTLTVFVKPPPFMNKAEGLHKFEKGKSNLAAAKAQDLFGIFYSTSGQQGPSSFHRPETDGKSLVSAPQTLQPRPQPLTQPQPPHPTQAPQDKPQPQLQSKIHTQPPNKAQTQPDQPLDKPLNELKPQTETQHQPLTYIQSPTKTQTSPQLDSNDCPPSPQTQTKPDIQIASVWSLQPTTASPSELVPMIQQKPTPDHDQQKPTPDHDQQKPTPDHDQQKPTPDHDPSSFEKQPSYPPFDSQTVPQSKPTETGPAEPQLKAASQYQAEPLSPSQLHQDTQVHPVTVPEPQFKSKPGPKTRGKSTPMKKTPPASTPTRQTRSRTRYQTRQQQQQNQPEAELVSGDHDSTAPDTKGLETSAQGSQIQPKAETNSEEKPPEVEIHPETLVLPSDMSPLDFDYHFNFE